MKIEIGESYTLIAGGLESPEDQAVNAQEAVQLIEAIRAASIQAINRGNLARVHTFQITRSYDSIGAAELALFKHPGEIPKSGDITITVEPCDESAPYITLANATVHAYAAVQTGKSIQWRYTITSGACSITEPE